LCFTAGLCTGAAAAAESAGCDFAAYTPDMCPLYCTTTGPIVLGLDQLS